jgi:hypothetical protein
MKKPRVRVTDHAVVRFLERVGGVDVEALRQGIARAVDEAARMGASAVTIDGFRYALEQDDQGPVVVTVHERSQDTPIRRSGRRRGEEA